MEDNIGRWLREVADDLGVPPDIPIDALLDAARVVAHAVERKATPLTTYLIGVAAGRSPDIDVEELCRRVVDLAEGRTDADGSGG